MERKAKPIATLLERADTDPETRAFLQRAQEIRAFAQGTLGLKKSRNYQNYADPGRDHIADVVQACAELSFKRYQWNYPFVGRQPYKGFFTRAEAEAEAGRLKKKSWDTIVRPVDAFSTLGFLSDPLWSYMRDYSEADLAELIIHELTHATAFSRDSNFNEELATFCGRQGAILYLRHKYGESSKAELDYRASMADSRAFASYLKATASELEALYARDMSDGDKRRAKAELIAKRAEEYPAWARLNIHSPAYWDFKMAGINNAYLDLFRLYEGEDELYQGYFDGPAASDFRAFVASAARYSKARRPKEAMRAGLEKSPGD